MASAFETRLAELAAKPYLYVGETSVRAAAHYLNGYADALSDLGEPYPLDDWQRWVEMTFMISHPAWHWSRILVHGCGSDRAAFDALPGLYGELREFVRHHGTGTVDPEHRRRFLAAFGVDHHAPDDAVGGSP